MFCPRRDLGKISESEAAETIKLPTIGLKLDLACIGWKQLVHAAGELRHAKQEDTENKGGVFAASRSAMPERTSSCSSALQLSWVSEAVSPYGSILRSEGLRRMINALAGKIIAAETAASTMYPVRQPCCSMTSVMTGLNNSVQRELTPQARPMARPDDFAEPLVNDIGHADARCKRKADADHCGGDGEHPDLGVERHCGAGGNKDEFNANMPWFADYFWNEATQKRKPKRKAKKNRGEIEKKKKCSQSPDLHILEQRMSRQ